MCFRIGWYTEYLEYAYTYHDPRCLYLNVTNRCTNRCDFCVRNQTDGLGGAVLWGGEEPDFPMLQAAVQHLSPLENWCEFIWCGYGEPTFRLGLIQEAAAWLRSQGAKIRLNTNGHACVIHGRDVMPDLSQSVDEVSISLNAPNQRRYLEVCRPDVCSIPGLGGMPITPSMFWEGMLDFLSRSPAYFRNVQASVVGFALNHGEIDECRLLAQSLGVKQFRVR
jgi:TatD DNase family protein